MKARAQMEKYLQAYERAIDKHEKEHPHWRIEVLVSLIKWALKSLKHYIEEPRERNITWNEPFVELHYEVVWNWEGRGSSDIAPGGHVFGKLTKANTVTPETAVKTMTEIMVRQLNAAALADATNWAWYEKRKNYYTPVLPLQVSTELNAINNKRQRRAYFDELVRPFSIGAARMDAGILELKSGGRVPKRLLESQPQMDVPGIRFAGEVNGREIDMGLIFEIHPMIADYDQKKAYHPIVVGLAILNAWLVNGEVVQDTPATWPQSDRERFWEQLLAEVEKITVALIPKVEAEGSVILSVNSQIKVPARCWQPENQGATIKQIADAHTQTGDLVSFSVAPIGNDMATMKPAACPVCRWFHDAGFTQFRKDGAEAFSLRGRLPEIVGLVHAAHKKDFPALSTKDDELLKVCAGYGNPYKAFDDLNRRAEYKLLFDTGKRGFISIRDAIGRNRNKSEASPE